MPKVVGVDMAVPGRGVIGLAAVEAASLTVIEAAAVQSIKEALGFVEKHLPVLVVVDAPLSLPGSGRGFRAAELWAIRVLGARLLPPTWRAMRRLAEAAARLARELAWTDIVETHPYSAARIAGAGSGIELLHCLGVSGAPPGARKDVVDAIVAASVGALLRHGLALLQWQEAALVFPLPGLCGP